MRYCFEPESEIKDPFGFRCIPKTNDFEDLEEYFLKKVRPPPPRDAAADGDRR